MPSMKSCDPEDGIDLCNEIMELLEYLPEKAEEFKDSVEKTVLDIHEWIDRHNHVTSKQMDALDRIKAGVEKWIHS